jgi:hypothetical protein
MAMRVVVQPNKLYAVFSEVVDDFIKQDADREDVLNFLREERQMSPADAELKVLMADNHPHRFTEALMIIRMVHGEAGRAQRMREMSAPRPVAARAAGK